MKNGSCQVLGVSLLAALAAGAEDFPVRVNQAGYLPDAPKICTMKDPPRPTFLVQKGNTNVCWSTVYEGTWTPSPSGGGVMLGDFSAVAEPGDYRILCGSTNGMGRFRMPDWKPSIQSFHFPVREDVYGPLARTLFSYITWQRCGSPKGWAGVCHQDPVPLVDADGRTVRTIDVRGGYHQSCDLRNWHDGIPLSLYALLRYAELSRPAWDDGEIAAELRWGCDYLLKVVGPEGYVYDAQFAPIGWGPRSYYLAPATLGAQCNVASLFARAARFFRADDPVYAARLTVTARRIWSEIEGNPFFETLQPAPERNLPPGSQPAEKCYHQQFRTSVNGLSERAMTALELFRTTGDVAFAATAKRLAAEQIRFLVREGEQSGTFVGADGRPAFQDWSYCWRLSGLNVPLEMWREFREDIWKDAALAIADRVAADCRKGGLRPGPRASSSTAAWRAIYLSACARAFDRKDFRPWAQRSFDWLLGANPWNVSYVEGVGQNQWQRPVFGQFFPSTPQIPGGVLHVEHGEYDMPPVALMLWAIAEL